jgi:hypothetical protein
LCYFVDDTLLWSPKNEWIEEVIKQLQDKGMTHEFLGVHMERNQTDGSIKLTQVGSTRRIIAAVGIESEPAAHTPTTSTPLTRDGEGEPPE